MTVSVVMPVYNGEDYLREAIDSILNQTFTDFEFIIINDGSTDNTKDIVLSYSDSRIVFLENEYNSGIVVTLNKGLDYAKGKYIARMDADDIALPERFEKQVDYMEKHKDIGALGTGTRIFGEDIETRDTHSTINSDKLKAELLFSTCMCHPSVMIRKSVLDLHHIRYDTQYRGAEDYELWWQIAMVSKIMTIPDVLHCYRIHPNQITQKKDRDYQMLLLRMLDLRMDTLGISLSNVEKECFLMYCTKEYRLFNKERFFTYIDILAKILRKNKQIHYFEQSSLQEVCGLSVTYASMNAMLTERERKECYSYAVKKGIYSYSMRLKLFAHRMIGR